MKNSSQKKIAKSLFLSSIIFAMQLGADAFDLNASFPSSMAMGMDPSGMSEEPAPYLENFITVSTAVGAVPISNPGFIPFSEIYSPGGSSEGFTFGTTPGTVVIPETGTYQLIYGITSATSAFGPSGFFAPAIGGGTEPKLLLVTSTAIPPWGGVAFGSYTNQALTFFQKGTEVGIALFSRAESSPSVLSLLAEPSGLPSAYMTLLRMY